MDAGNVMSKNRKRKNKRYRNSCTLNNLNYQQLAADWQIISRTATHQTATGRTIDERRREAEEFNRFMRELHIIDEISPWRYNPRQG